MNELWLNFTQTTDFKSKVSTDQELVEERHLFILLKLQINIASLTEESEKIVQIQAFSDEDHELTHKNKIRVSTKEKKQKDASFLFLKVPFSTLCK